MLKKTKKIIDDAIDFNGIDEQLNMAMEECGELGAAINHFRRKKITKNALIKEMSDVVLTIQFLMTIHNIKQDELESMVDVCLHNIKSRTGK